MKRKPDKNLKVVPEPTKQELAAQLVDLFKKATGGEYSVRPAREVARQCLNYIYGNNIELHIENITLMARMVNFPPRIEVIDLPGQGVGFVERKPDNGVRS
jgi:hypothetical protein